MIMIFNKPLNTAIALLLALFASSMTKAATDSTEITISHTYTPYVNLIGTAPGASHFFDNDDLVNTIIPVPVNLGTLGLASNVSGDCDLNFSTDNTFKLVHTVASTNLAFYSILYDGVTLNETSNPQITRPCNFAPTDIEFIVTGAISTVGNDFFLLAGVYRDVVTVTVTTQ